MDKWALTLHPPASNFLFTMLFKIRHNQCSSNLLLHALIPFEIDSIAIMFLTARRKKARFCCSIN